MPRVSHLSIELLQTFTTLLRHDGDAAQAAKALGINQPSMSKRLKSLRTSRAVLKRAWVKRIGKSWLLTDEGRRVWPAVQELLGRYRQLQQVTTDTSPPEPAALRFACGQTAAVQLVRNALYEWRKRNPQLPIRISTMRSDIVALGVASGAVDMALVAHTEKELAELSRVRMRLEHFARYSFAVVCSPRAPFASAVRKLPKIVSLKALAQLPLVLPEPDSATRQAIDRALAKRKLTRQMRLVIETGGWLTILAYVRSGLGVGIISEAALPSPDAPELLVRRINPRDLPPEELKLLTRAGDNGADSAAVSLARAWREALIKSEQQLAARRR